MGRPSTIPIRTQQISNYLMDTQASARDISHALTIPYNIVCQAIVILKKQDRIAAVDLTPTGAPIYSNKTFDPMPKLTMQGYQYSAIDFAQNMQERARANNNVFNSAPVEEAVAWVGMSLCSLLHQSVLMAEQNVINEREFDRTIRALIAAEQRFIGMAQFCRQILDEPNFSNKEGFRAISFSPNWNAELIKSIYATLWSKPDSFNP